MPRSSGSSRPSTAPAGMVRLQKLMADAGVAARRVCERLIEEGHVEVNGERVVRLPVFVDPFADKVVVEGRELPRAMRRSRGKDDDAGTGGAGAEMQRKVYLMLHKPQRVLTAASDPTGRVTVNELVKYPGMGPGGVRLFPVGRLEWEATGLVLITNDGVLANTLTHPRYGVERVYEAAVKGVMRVDFVADLEKGVNLKAQRIAREGGGRAGPIKLELAPFAVGGADGGREGNAKTLLRLTVRPGNSIKLADLLGEAGVKVARLTQVSLGPLKLIDVPRPGDWRELEKHEVAALKRAAKRAEGGGGSSEPRPAGSGGAGRRTPRGPASPKDRASSSSTIRRGGAGGGARG